MSGVIVIGAGMAGLGVARELRALRPDLRVRVVTDDDGHHYPKPQLSTSLRTGKQPEQLITMRAEALVAQGIELVTRTRVAGIRTHDRVVVLADGQELAYDDLVVATGASPFVPPMLGNTDAVLTVNHLNDYQRFRDLLEPGRSVLLIGGGLIGVEFAADLLSQGHPVHVVDPGAGPLPRLLPAGAASLLTGALERAGAAFSWGRTVSRLEGQAGDFVAQLSDGQVVEAHLVLSAVGLRPNVALAREAGLNVGRGVLVDSHLRAADHHYALGDCAELAGGIYLPFIKPIGEQAKFVARAIAGETQAAYAPGNYAIVAKVPQWPVMSTTPLPNEEGVWEETLDDAGSLSQLRDSQGRVVRVVATGNRTPELREWLPKMPSLGGQPAPVS
jgi:rubredoxin-NAD+ reductase